MNSDQHGILVVIPCLNEEDYIQEIVAFCHQETLGSSSHIVVADGGSSDNTLLILKQLSMKMPNLTILENHKKIQSVGVNLAVERFGHDFDYFVRIDVHASYPSQYISTLLDEAKTHNADSVVVSMDTQGKNPVQSLIALAQNSPLGNGGSSHRNTQNSGKWVEHGHHALMSTDAFLSVGGYDESFSHNEDAELDARLTKAGFKIWLTNATNLIYYPRSQLIPLAKQYAGYGKGRCQNLLKHQEKPRLRQWVPVFVFPCLLLAILSVFHWVFAIPALTWFFATLLAGAIIAAKSSTTLTTLKYAVWLPAMIMHLAWSYGFCMQLSKHVLQPKNKREVSHEH
ncbi:glycosyltransferase family 2 protein [Vibrio sp. YMD68]|uniref:glycosyltransferase family 2 protein n=1 Tax=Vibrio sp. YMD68 TaxID=3042300 RepID=UPI00249CD9D3|nr:glycosyltransferase family 2 protein [Vibrio sp. YMD68]WGV98437.1 glycosyltransferase family 2 protein [Vibrio sp. YMD68]